MEDPFLEFNENKTQCIKILKKYNDNLPDKIDKAVFLETLIERTSKEDLDYLLDNIVDCDYFKIVITHLKYYICGCYYFETQHLNHSENINLFLNKVSDYIDNLVKNNINGNLAAYGDTEKFAFLLNASSKKVFKKKYKNQLLSKFNEEIMFKKTTKVYRELHS